MRRSTFPIKSTWPVDSEHINGRKVVEEDETPFSHFSTEPGPHSRRYEDGDTIRRESKEQCEMTTAAGNSSWIARPTGGDAEEIVVERVLTRRPSEDTVPKARRRYLFDFNNRMNKLGASLRV